MIKGTAVCKLCNATIKYCGGTTNLNTHIHRHHPRVPGLSKHVVKYENTDQPFSVPVIKQAKQSTIGIHRNAHSNVPYLFNDCLISKLMVD